MKITNVFLMAGIAITSLSCRTTESNIQSDTPEHGLFDTRATVKGTLIEYDDVLPIFTNRCSECHNSREANIKAVAEKFPPNWLVKGFASIKEEREEMRGEVITYPQEMPKDHPKFDTWPKPEQRLFKGYVNQQTFEDVGLGNMRLYSAPFLAGSMVRGAFKKPKKISDSEMINFFTKVTSERPRCEECLRLVNAVINSSSLQNLDLPANIYPGLSNKEWWSGRTVTGPGFELYERLVLEGSLPEEAELDEPDVPDSAYYVAWSLPDRKLVFNWLSQKGVEVSIMEFNKIQAEVSGREWKSICCFNQKRKGMDQ